MIASLLDIDRDLEIVAIVLLGYPDHMPAMPPKQDINQKVRWLGLRVIGKIKPSMKSNTEHFHK
jgi:hypothetical protein